MNISYNQAVFRNPSSSHFQGIHKIYGKKPSTMLNSTALMYKPKESFNTDSSMDESIRVRLCMERIVGVVDTDEELIIFSEKRFSVLYRDYSSDEFLRLNSSQSELLVSGRAKTQSLIISSIRRFLAPLSTATVDKTETDIICRLREGSAAVYLPFTEYYFGLWRPTLRFWIRNVDSACRCAKMHKSLYQSSWYYSCNWQFDDD